MKIRALRLENFKKFDRAVGVEGFGDGLNVIAGPNETGKSTLLLALRAVLFERHGSKAQAIKDLAPHHVAGAAPEVAVDFEIGGGRYRLEKRFLRSPMARLETPDGQRYEGSAAEAEAKRLLGLNASEKSPIDKDSPAHFGVMLTPQTRSFSQPTLATATRHNLESAIATEIAELGNQSDVDGLLADLRQEHAVFIDGHGKPKGRYKEVDARLETLDREIDELEKKRDLLHHDIEALNRAIAERDELASAEDGAGLADRLESLEAARTDTARRQALENKRLAAVHRLQQLEAERMASANRLEECRRLTMEMAEIDQELESVSERLAVAEQNMAEREKAWLDLGEKRDRLAGRKRHLEKLGEQIERRRQIDSTLAALATEVRFDIDDSAFDRLTVNAEPLTGARSAVQVTEGMSIIIEGIGRIMIEPKTEPMRDALDARDRVEAAIADIMTVLGLDDADHAAIEDFWQTINADKETIDTERADLETALSDERQQSAETKAVWEGLRDRRRRLEERVGQSMLADNDSDHVARLKTLAGEMAEAESAAEAAEKECREAKAGQEEPSSLPLEQLEAEIRTLKTRLGDRQQRLDAVGKDIVRLESAISVRAGLGLDERIDQLDRQRHLLAKEWDAFKRDNAALILLQKTLRDAAETAKATFNAPLSARLTPYIRDLFPEATPLVTPAFDIRALDRGGVEEPFGDLSDGTREQIAVLVRLAFAAMLKEQGLPSLVVLDDALVFSDDERLLRVFRILEHAADDLQIIILTCREDRFANLNAKRLHIEHLASSRPVAQVVEA